MHKTHLKSLLLRFCLLEIIVRPCISLMAKFKCVTFLASKLEHFENDKFLLRHLVYRYLKNIPLNALFYFSIWEIKKRANNFAREVYISISTRVTVRVTELKETHSKNTIFIFFSWFSVKFFFTGNLGLRISSLIKN